MASNKVQIQVELKGAQQVNKQLDSIEKNSVDLSEGFKGVGESFKSVGDVVKAQGGMMGDAFGVLGESVGAITDSVGSFKGAMEVAGQTGGKAWLAMLGPIAAVVSGVSLAIEAYREFSGANRAAEDAAENMAAAASDTASRLEAMVEAGVDLSSAALKEFIQVNERARLAMEETIKANEKRTVSDQKVKAAVQAVKDAEESLFFTDMRVAMATRDLELATTQYNKALDEQVAKSKEANKLNKEAFELQELLIKSSQEFLDIYLQERERSDELSLRITNTTNIRGKEKKIIEDTLFKKKQLIDEEIRYKDAIRVLEGQLKKGALSQELFDASTKQLKTNLRDTAKQIKETNDILEPYVKNLEATKEAQDGLKSLGKEAFSKRNAENIQDLNRELTLLDRTLQDQKDTLTNYGFEFKKQIDTNKNSILGLVTELEKAEEKFDMTKRLLKQSVKEELIIPPKGFSFDFSKVTFPEEERKKALNEMLNIEKQTLEKLIETEEKRVEVLLFLRLEEINGMEISERKKKKLREEALADALYTTEKLKETTKNFLKDQISASIRSYADLQKIEKEKATNLLKEEMNIAEAKYNIDKQVLNSELQKYKDISSLVAEKNEEIQVFEFNSLKERLKKEEQIRESELLDLRYYLITKKNLLKDFASRYTEDERKTLEIEIKDLKNQIEVKTQINETAQKMEKIRLDISRNTAREAIKENYIMQVRYDNLWTSTMLDNTQLRSNLEYNAMKEQLSEIDDLLAQSNLKYEEEMSRSIDTIAQKYVKIESVKESMIGKTAFGAGVIGVYEAEIEGEKYKQKELLRVKVGAEKEHAEIKKTLLAKEAQYDLEHYQAVGSLIKDFSDSSAQAFINAGVAAAFAGESISDAIRTTLRGLAQEATARALYEGAAALGSLAIGDARGAALHGKSAAAFGIAAVGMGALTAAVGVPGGGSSGGGGTTSPTGLSQTSEAPQRESAKTEAMVFNINFGNAVIYDTRAAAERAMAERVMELGTRARRGYNPPRPRI